MTINELKERLRAEKIPEGWYCLEQEGYRDDTTRLLFTKGKWLVYYIERGMKSDISEFETESDACEELLSRMLEDINSYRR